MKVKKIEKIRGLATLNFFVGFGEPKSKVCIHQLALMNKF